MVDAIVSSLLVQLSSVATDEVKQQVRLVTGVEEEVKKLTRNLRAIRAVLEDAFFSFSVYQLEPLCQMVQLSQAP